MSLLIDYCNIKQIKTFDLVVFKLKNNLQIKKTFHIMGETNLFACTATYLTCMHCQAEIHMTDPQTGARARPIRQDHRQGTRQTDRTERRPGGAMGRRQARRTDRPMTERQRDRAVHPIQKHSSIVSYVAL